jgi:thiol-activated cytolysin
MPGPHFFPPAPKHIQTMILLALLALLLVQCGGDDGVTTPQYGDEIDAEIAALDHIEQADPFSERPVGEPSTETYEFDGRFYECGEQQYEMAAEFDRQVALNPMSDILWPGSIIDGATILSGDYVPIIGERAPLRISVSLVNIEGETARDVQSPSLSTMRTAISDILTQNVTGATAAYVTHEISQVYSEEQFNLALGASLTDGRFAIARQFDFSNTEILSRTLVKFMQIYYTIDIDLPAKPSDLFAPSVSWSQLQGQISAATSPMYISSISYGRMAIFSMESTYSGLQVEDAVRASLVAIDAGVEVNPAYGTVLQNTTIKATIIGGSGAAAVLSVDGFAGLRQYMLAGGDYDSDTAGAPMAYHLRYLSDNASGRVVMAQSYVVRTCEELVDGYYAFFTTAPYETRIHIYYTLDGQPQDVLSPAMYSPLGAPRWELTVPRLATAVYITASSHWLGNFYPIFRYPQSGTLPHPTTRCWTFSGLFGNNPQYEVDEDCSEF